MLSSVSHSQPKATFQFTGGYSMPVGSLRGDFGSTSITFTEHNPDTNSYYMKTGYGYGLVFKKAFGKERHLEIVGGLYFNLFQQSVDYNTSTDSSVSVKLRMNITSLSLGAEWAFMPKNRHINPFVGVTLDGNLFSGSLVEAFLTITNTMNLWSALRLGATFNAGIDIPFQQNVGVVIGTRYCFANLIGKSYREDNLINYGLNDAEHTINNIYYPARTIKFLQFYGGISFYFGR
jgi:hypothetical protein